MEKVVVLKKGSLAAVITDRKHVLIEQRRDFGSIQEHWVSLNIDDLKRIIAEADRDN